VVGVTSLASTLMTLKRYEDAQKTIAKHEANLNVYKTRDDKKSEANCYLVLGQAYLETQQLRLAVESFDLSCRLREELGDEEGMASALKRKGCALFSTGDMKSAVEVLEEYLSIVSRQADRRVFLSKNFKDSRREEVDACSVVLARPWPT
jgi:tetratricopeptide (TPR) repeat protein